MKLEIIPSDQIIVTERFRKEFDGPGEGESIDRLAADMKVHGIIQPLAVTKDYTLLAGERRLIAAKLAEITQIPVRIYDEDLSEDQMRSIEMSENLWRKNFHPREKANLYREIVALEQRIHGEKLSTSSNAPGSLIVLRSKIITTSSSSSEFGSRS